jgi:hypothetical protein
MASFSGGSPRLQSGERGFSSLAAAFAQFVCGFQPRDFCPDAEYLVFIGKTESETPSALANNFAESNESPRLKAAKG